MTAGKLTLVVGLSICLAALSLACAAATSASRTASTSDRAKSHAVPAAALTAVSAASGPQQFRDARAACDAMIATMRSAQTLGWISHHRWEAQCREISHCTYRIWMRKPNHARIEVTGADGKLSGVLALDGTYAWIYWPGGRPYHGIDDAATYARTRLTTY